jgi:hypothetical protein
MLCINYIVFCKAGKFLGIVRVAALMKDRRQYLGCKHVYQVLPSFRIQNTEDRG